MTKQIQQLDHDIIGSAGDSGTACSSAETSIFGNDLSTLPNIPAEIQAAAEPRGGTRLPARLAHVSLSLKRQLRDLRQRQSTATHGPESTFVFPVRPGKQPR